MDQVDSNLQKTYKEYLTLCKEGNVSVIDAELRSHCCYECGEGWTSCTFMNLCEAAVTVGDDDILHMLSTKPYNIINVVAACSQPTIVKWCEDAARKGCVSKVSLFLSRISKDIYGQMLLQIMCIAAHFAHGCLIDYLVATDQVPDEGWQTIIQNAVHGTTDSLKCLCSLLVHSSRPKPDINKYLVAAATRSLGVRVGNNTLTEILLILSEAIVWNCERMFPNGDGRKDAIHTALTRVYNMAADKHEPVLKFIDELFIRYT